MSRKDFKRIVESLEPADAQVLHELADFCRKRGQFWAGRTRTNMTEDQRMITWVGLMDSFRSKAIEVEKPR